jgi:hypothetical protein
MLVALIKDISAALSVTIKRAVIYANHVSSRKPPRFSRAADKGRVMQNIPTYITMLKVTQVSNRDQIKFLRSWLLHKHRKSKTVITIRPTDISMVPILIIK